MPFGHADRESLRHISQQLSSITADLAAIKQQVADQQHSVDRIREDATAAITTGLAEIRAVAREAMTRTNDITSGALADVGSELVTIRGAVAQLESRVRSEAFGRPTGPEPGEGREREPAPKPVADPETRPEPQAPAPEPDPGQQPASETSDPADVDPDVLRAAAGVAHATVEAHRDTWAFLIQVAGNEQHFHIPGKVDDHEGFVSVRFSGPSLVAAMTSLGHVHATTGNPVTRAIADHIRFKITAAVRDIMDNPGRGGDGTPVRIVIDDRAALSLTDDDTGS